MRSGSSSPTSRARDTVDSGRMKARDHPYAFTSSFRERRLGPSPPSSHLPPVPLFPLLSLSPHNSLCPSPLHSISLSLSLYLPSLSAELSVQPDAARRVLASACQCCKVKVCFCFKESFHSTAQSLKPRSVRVFNSPISTTSCLLSGWRCGN